MLKTLQTSKKPIFLFGALILFGIFLIGIVSANVNFALDGTPSGTWNNNGVITNINDDNVATYIESYCRSDGCSTSLTGITTFDNPIHLEDLKVHLYLNWGDTSHRWGGYANIFVQADGFWHELPHTWDTVGGIGDVRDWGYTPPNDITLEAPGDWSDVTAIKVYIYGRVGGHTSDVKLRLYEIEAFGTEQVVEPVCGNNVLEENEECDDGNTENGDGCSSECSIEPEPPECCDDSDCPVDYSEDNYCIGNDVYYDFHDFFCENGECFEEVISELAEECSYDCVNGECIDEPEQPACYVNEDCGTNYCLGEANYCLDGDVYQDFMVYTCNNPGESDAYCSDNTIPWLLDTCDSDEICEDGECIDEPEPPEPICGNNVLEQDEECDDGNLINEDGCSSICEIEEPEPPEECCSDEDCEEDYYSDNYCDGGDVYQDFHDWSCVDDECVENIISKLVEECDEDCEDGECVEEDDDKRRSCRSKDDDDFDEEVLSFYNKVDTSSENGRLILVGQPDSIGQAYSVEESDNSWILYLFIGCLGLLVLILISLAIRR